MPWNTPAPDDRAVGTADPPADNNANAAAIADVQDGLGDREALLDGNADLAARIAADKEEASSTFAPRDPAEWAEGNAAFVSALLLPALDRHRLVLADDGKGSGAPGTAKFGGQTFTFESATAGWIREADGFRRSGDINTYAAMLADVGSSDYEIDVTCLRPAAASTTQFQAAFAWVDASNNMRAVIREVASGPEFSIIQVVGGVPTQLAVSTTGIPQTGNRSRRVRIACSDLGDRLRVAATLGGVTLPVDVTGAAYAALSAGTKVGLRTHNTNARFTDWVVRTGAFL